MPTQVTYPAPGHHAATGLVPGAVLVDGPHPGDIVAPSPRNTVTMCRHAAMNVLDAGKCPYPHDTSCRSSRARTRSRPGGRIPDAVRIRAQILRRSTGGIAGRRRVGSICTTGTPRDFGPYPRRTMRMAPPSRVISDDFGSRPARHRELRDRLIVIGRPGLIHAEERGQARRERRARSRRAGLAGRNARNRERHAGSGDHE